MTIVANLYSNSFSFYANSTSISNTTDTILITNANTYLSVNNMVRYIVPSDNTAIEGLLANSAYYISFVNSSAVALSLTKGGSNVDITDSKANTGETHFLYLNNPTLNSIVLANTTLTIQSSNSANSLDVEYLSTDLTISTNTLNLGTSNLSSNGFTWLPNGLKINWGVFNCNTTSTVTFSNAFPNAILAISITARSNILVGANTPFVSSSNVTAANIFSAATSTSGANAYYLAIGY